MNRFIILYTKRYKRKGFKNRRRHLGLCTYCFRKFKLMTLHFEKYHPEAFEGFRRVLKNGIIGQINGMKVIQTYGQVR